MKHLLILSALWPISSNCQFIIPSVEPVLGINYFKPIEVPWESKKYPGIGIYYGIRGACLFGNRISVSAGTGVKSYPLEKDYFFNSTVKTYFYRDYDTNFSAFCELGIETSIWGGTTLPFYLGTNQYLGKKISFNFRVRIPTSIEKIILPYPYQTELGLEIGLQFDLSVQKTKTLTRSGNPFILN